MSSSYQTKAMTFCLSRPLMSTGSITIQLKHNIEINDI